MTSSFCQFRQSSRLSLSGNLRIYWVSWLSGLMLCALLNYPSTARADYWDLPKPVDYYSADSSYLLRVVPTIIPAKYGAWQTAKPKNKRRYSARDTTVIPCHATLFHRVQQALVPVWQQDLINRWAPLQALVSKDGRYVVTLDNWASVGYGVDVVVVYDQQGALRKRVNLESISPYPLNFYTKSISSIWWRCGASLVDNETLTLCFQDWEGHTTAKQLELPELTPR